MEPEEIFRFVNVRPVQKAPENRAKRRFAAYSDAKISPFHATAEQISGEDARDKLIELARGWLAENNLDSKKAAALATTVNKIAASDNVSEAKKLAKQLLGKQVSEYLGGGEAQRLKDLLWDRLYASTLVPEENPEERDLIYQGVRAFHFLETLSVQADGDRLLGKDELSAVTPLIPKGLVPSTTIVNRQEDEKYAREIAREFDKIIKKVDATNTAINELKSGERKHLAERLRARVDIFAAAGHGLQQLRTVHVVRPSIEIPPKIDIESVETNEPSGVPGEAVATLPVEQKLLVVPKKTPWVFEEFGQNALSNSTKELLSARKTSLLEFEAIEIIDTLEQEKYETVDTFLRNLPQEAFEYIYQEAKFIDLMKEVSIPWFPFVPPAPKPGSDTAAARGIKPLGIGDLLVVRQELLRYAAGEVAHIENVLKSEVKSRTHTRMREVEEITITETEQLEETEKDLQTTERFELSKESEKTIESQMKLEAGVSVTASYGPVSLTAHADFALSQSSSESNRTASTFAKQITERSVQRIMKRAREERTRRTLERFEEKNEHGFDNKTGNKHVIGIYRWVDKYYKARLLNYGRRLMIEFIVPEPAAFYLYLQSNQPLKGVTMKEPTPPIVSGRPLQPSDLTKSNYNYYVSQYNVRDIDPYPAEVVRVSAAFGESVGTTDNVDIGKTSEKLAVPPGYKCHDVFGEIGWQGSKGTSYFLECLIGGQRWGSVTAADIEGVIPISVIGWVRAFHINVVAICHVKPETKAEWQIKTYEAIMNAYEQALANYQEQVSAAQIQAGVMIQGRNPEFNRKIERDELKKGVLRLLTNNFAQTRVSGVWRFNEVFNAMKAVGTFGYPEFDIKEAIVEGRIIQFFEQAFEWNNMTFRFYPYFWGRKGSWRQNFPLTDTDPQFIDFLRAGAARVVVPVHPSYNETILHYMQTNEIWNGGEPPTLDDPLYISIVDELKSDAGGDIDEEDLPQCSPNSEYPCLVDEWEVKLPTTLVYLQEDAKLPDFSKP